MGKVHVSGQVRYWSLTSLYITQMISDRRVSAECGFCLYCMAYGVATATRKIQRLTITVMTNRRLRWLRVECYSTNSPPTQYSSATACCSCAALPRPRTNGWERAGPWQEHRRGQVEGLGGQGQDTALAVPHTWPECTEHVHWSAFQPLACVLPAQIDADSFVTAGCRCTTNRTLTCGAWMACRV